MIKRPAPYISLALTIFLSINGLAQTQGVARTGAQTGAGTAAAKKNVTSENIESDIAEALSVVEANHVSGKRSIITR